MNTEEDGSTAPTVDAYDLDLAQTAGFTPSNADSPPGNHSGKRNATSFAPGYDPRRNYAGRPKKGESVPEQLKRTLERPKVARMVVNAVVERLARTDAVGNRAFSDVRDTIYGVPKQTLVLQQGTDPLTALFTELADHRLLPEHTQDT